MLNKLPLIALLSSALFITACAEEKEGPVEKAGKKIDATYQEVKKDAKELGDKMSDKIDDVKDNSSDAAKTIKDKTAETIDKVKEKVEESDDDN